MTTVIFFTVIKGAPPARQRRISAYRHAEGRELAGRESVS
jgi:hypothetical protein